MDHGQRVLSMKETVSIYRNLIHEPCTQCIILNRCFHFLFLLLSSKKTHSIFLTYKKNSSNLELFSIGMELFSSRRWRIDWPMQKAIVFMLNPQKLCNTCMTSVHKCLTVKPIGCTRIASKVRLHIKRIVLKNVIYLLVQNIIKWCMVS